jgi:predicted  nucleic acid-binding Zn-ribbon protein
MATSKEAQAAAAESMRRYKALNPEAWEAIQDQVYAEYGVTRRKRLSPEEKAAREAADQAAKAKAKIVALAKKAGVRVQFAVESTEDAVANVEILQAMTRSEPVDPAGEDEEVRAARERYDATVSKVGPLAVF